MISIDYLKHLKYKRCIGDAENNVRRASRARSLAKAALGARMHEFNARRRKEQSQIIMRSLLMHKSIASHAKTINAQVERLVTFFQDHERAVAAERAALDEMRRSCDDAKSHFVDSVTNWDAREAVTTMGLSLHGNTRDLLERDTERVKICGQIDILSNGTIKRRLCHLFECVDPGSAFDTARVVLRFSRDAA